MPSQTAPSLGGLVTLFRGQLNTPPGPLMKSGSSGCAENAVCHAKPQLLGRAQRKRLTLWSSRRGQMYDSQPAVSLDVLPEQTKMHEGCDRVDPTVVQVWPRWALCSGGESPLRDAWPKWRHHFLPAGSHSNLGQPPQAEMVCRFRVSPMLYTPGP